MLVATSLLPSTPERFIEKCEKNNHEASHSDIEQDCRQPVRVDDSVTQTYTIKTPITHGPERAIGGLSRVGERTTLPALPKIGMVAHHSCLEFEQQVEVRGITQEHPQDSQQKQYFHNHFSHPSMAANFTMAWPPHSPRLQTPFVDCLSEYHTWIGTVPHLGPPTYIVRVHVAKHRSNLLRRPAILHQVITNELRRLAVLEQPARAIARGY